VWCYGDQRGDPLGRAGVDVAAGVKADFLLAAETDEVLIPARAPWSDLSSRNSIPRKNLNAFQSPAMAALVVPVYSLKFGWWKSGTPQRKSSLAALIVDRPDSRSAVRRADYDGRVTVWPTRSIRSRKAELLLAIVAQ
jgi:hypothetical protein